jgi:hypothetical protein
MSDKIARVTPREIAEMIWTEQAYAATRFVLAAQHDAEIERLRARNEALWEAFGVLTTLAPKMEINTSDPMGMARKIEATVRAALEAKP